jgi:hypothetical protein
MKFNKAALLSNLTEQTQKQAKVVVDSVLNQIVDGLMFHSPVGQPDEWRTVVPDTDYTPGTYKANWMYTTDEPVFEFDDVIRDNSFQDTNCVTGRTLKKYIHLNKKLVTTHYFTNSTPYAIDIEFGSAIHNPQAQSKPHAVAGKVTQNIESYIAKAKSGVVK